MGLEPLGHHTIPIHTKPRHAIPRPLQRCAAWNHMKACSHTCSRSIHLHSKVVTLVPGSSFLPNVLICTKPSDRSRNKFKGCRSFENDCLPQAPIVKHVENRVPPEWFVSCGLVVTCPSNQWCLLHMEAYRSRIHSWKVKGLTNHILQALDPRERTRFIAWMTGRFPANAPKSVHQVFGSVHRLLGSAVRLSQLPRYRPGCSLPGLIESISGTVQPCAKS